MRVQLQKILVVFALMVLALAGRQTAQAAAVDVVVTGDEYTSVSVRVGDTGKIQPQPGQLTGSMGQPVSVAKWLYSGYDMKIIQVDEAGNYQAIAYGDTAVTVHGCDETGTVVFSTVCYFYVQHDMTYVTLASSQLNGYMTYNGKYYGRIGINSPFAINQENSSVSCTTDNPEMDVRCSLFENEVQIETADEGKTKVFVSLNGKTFEIELTVTRLEISKRSYVAAKGKTTKLRVKGAKEPVRWVSSNAKAVKVSDDGTVSCRKTGNAVVTAQIGGMKLGCAVSVVSPKLYKVIKRAKKIGANWKYSQPKRMQSGFYDCSSLVWKSYKLMGKTFGMSHYAPVAADEAKWCARHGKRITKSYTDNHIQKMKLRPGDLMFETGKKNGRYKGIYHVEMFVGYAVEYYDTEEKPVLNELWAARPEGYYGGGHMIMRP